MTDAAGDLIHTTQAKFNRSTRQQWKLYASHRQAVERLLVAHRRPAARLCVLGAGNCNDLDLQWLAESRGGFGEVHLVDLDPAALERAVRRQGVEDSPVIRRHAPVDLTGVVEVFGRWQRERPAAGEVDACVRRALDAAVTLPGPFDVVLSPCVLSQLITPLRDALSERHPRFPELLSAVRLRHLRLMAELLAPGGVGLLVTDLVSSGTFEHLADVPRGELSGLMRKLIAEGNFFSGLAPESLLAVLGKDPVLAARVSDVELVPPWLWHLAPRKTFLVYAVRFRVRGGGAGGLIVVP